MVENVDSTYTSPLQNSTVSESSSMPFRIPGKNSTVFGL